MRTPGKTLDDHLAIVSESFPKDDVTRIMGVKCEADIISSSVFLEYHSKFDDTYPNRPYLHIVGECRAIRGDLPYDVSEITFEKGRGIDTEFFYEFTDAELADMTAKGLFHKGFKCPDIFFDNKFELPVICDFRVVNPENESDIPIIFANIVGQKNIAIDEASCGYTFGDYFETYEPETERQADDVYTEEYAEDKELSVAQEEDQAEVPVFEEPVAEEDEVELANAYDAIQSRVQAHIDGDKKAKESEPEETVSDDEPIDDSDMLDDDSFEYVEGRNEPKEVSSKVDMIAADDEQYQQSDEKQ